MKNFKEVRAPKIKKGLRDKKGKLHTVDMKLDGSKLSFRVTDEFGSFKTVNAKGLARMFEGTDVDKFIEEARGYGKKPVSMMTPAEKKKDAERRKEYKAYQKGKREDVNERLDLVLTVRGDKNVPLAKTAMKKFKGVSVKRQGKVRSGEVITFGGDEKQLQKMQSALAGKIKGLDMTSKHEQFNENYNQDLTLATKNMARLAQKETGEDKKDYMAVSRALAQGNLGAVKRVIKGISTKEIQADILNVLVGYNALIAKMYPKATDAKGNLKRMSVDKLIQEQNCGCGKTPCETYGNVEEAMNPKDKAKRLKLIKKAVERINKNNAEKAKKDALKMMKDSGMFDESVEITEGKQSYVDQMRDIVAKKSAKKINGVMVDMFTASAVVKVYAAINDTNKAKMDKMTVPAMANVAFKLMKK